jgi:hypothetical protein
MLQKSRKAYHAVFAIFPADSCFEKFNFAEKTHHRKHQKKKAVLSRTSQ